LQWGELQEERTIFRKSGSSTGRWAHLGAGGDGASAGRGDIRWERGPFAGIGGPQASLGAICRDRWSRCRGTYVRGGTVYREPSAIRRKERDANHGKGHLLQVAICTERRTIFRVRGSYAWKGEPSVEGGDHSRGRGGRCWTGLPAGGTGPYARGGTIFRGREPYAWKGEPSSG
jgi:hypothetical protein